MRIIILSFTLVLLTCCNGDKSKSNYLMIPKTLEKELTDSIPENPIYSIKKYFSQRSDSSYCQYSLNNGTTWGILMDGKPITGSLYIQIEPIDDYFCITRRIPSEKINLSGYGEYQEFDDWTAVVSNQAKIIVPFSLEFGIDNVKAVEINGNNYIAISSVVESDYYNTKTGEYYQPSLNDNIIELLE